MGSTLKTILLVEDQGIIALATKMMLEGCGYRVVVANSGEQAIETMNSSVPIDLVLMDINLGEGMDGTEAAKILLKEHSLPLIFLSSHTERAVVERTEGITSYGYIVKDSGETVVTASIKMAFKLFEANKKIAQNEQRLSAIIDNEPECVALLDESNYFLEINSAGLSMFEAQSLNELKPHSFSHFVKPAYQKAYSDFQQRVLQGKTEVLEFEINGLNGSRRWLEVHATALRNDNPQSISLLCVARDVTEKKKAFHLLTAINLINSLMVRDLSLQEVMNDACRILVHEGNFKMSWIGWINAETSQVEPVVVVGDTFDYVKNIKVYADQRPEGQGPIGISLREGRPVVVQDAMSDPRLAPWLAMRKKTSWNSSISIPIYMEGSVRAALVVYSDEVNYFNEQEINMLESVTSGFQVVAERTRMKNLLVDSEHFLKEVTNNVPGMFAYWGSNLQCRFANPGYREWFGKSTEEMKRINLRQLLGEPLYEKNKPFIDGALKGERQQFERQLIKANGEMGYTLAQYIPHFSHNEVVGFFAMVTDITSVKLHEQMLRESEQFAYSTLNALSAQIAILDEHGTIVFVNNAWTRFTWSNVAPGTEVFSMVGKNYLHVCDSSDAEEAAKMARGIRDILTNVRDEFSMEYPCHSPTEKRWFVVNVTKFDAKGKRKVVVAHENITERKKSDEHVLRLLNEKTILLKEIHHRIKNNISNIEGLLYLQMKGNRHPEAIDALQDAIRRVRSVRVLYDKLLVEDGKADVSVKSYLDGLVSTVVELFPNRDTILIDSEIDDFMLSSRLLFPLGIILNELITNTIKYAFVNRDQGKLKLQLLRVGPKVTLTVHDNGNGLPEGFNSQDSKGFGLTLVQMLTQQLGGSLSISNDNGAKVILEFEV